ncbi:hypothetical protein C4J81_06885 [Deltaproteobacteria bacterium Smac51]|nr:hypothetical protein C4J81_06885 [Deltaproteobacteria bacterium Smac51]
MAGYVCTETIDYVNLINRMEKTRDMYLIVDGAIDGMPEMIERCYRNGWTAYPLAPPDSFFKSSDLIQLPHILGEYPLNFAMELGGKFLGANAFIFVSGGRDILAVRSALVKMLWVDLPGGGKPAWFRFYAPNVLRAFFQKAGPADLNFAFGGGIAGYWCELIPGGSADSPPNEYLKPVERLTFFALPAGGTDPAGERLAFNGSRMAVMIEEHAEYLTTLVCRHLAARIGAEDDRWPRLRGFAGKSIEQAAAYGLAACRALCLYVEAAMVYGENFAIELDETRTVIPKPGFPDNYKEEVLERLLKRA